mmetsp:Transcript_31529/g.104532  ORF Transcript_31529/g.104532 Transcript_31529/m.104532 type:complete len:430 (+) Transcript_31529:68-1357(+)
MPQCGRSSSTPSGRASRETMYRVDSQAYASDPGPTASLCGKGSSTPDGRASREPMYRVDSQDGIPSERVGIPRAAHIPRAAPRAAPRSQAVALLRPQGQHSAQVRDASPGQPGQAPLKAAFNAGDVQAWEPKNFRRIRKIADARASHGLVLQMIDSFTGKNVAVKQIPNSWICQRPEDFDQRHDSGEEQPWVDIGCAALLTSAAYQYACPLLGVFRDDQTTHIVTELAREGDLFSWCCRPQVSAPGPERETLVRALARQIMDSVRQLHDISIVHGDMSLQNILLSRPLEIQLIDFGKSSTSRFLSSGRRCKPSYEAPEMHTGEEFDGFLSDAFAVGVTLYALLCDDYPWLSTRPGRCKCFKYFHQNGFRAFIEKRRIRTGAHVDKLLSEPVVALLSGLLDPDPAARLTLGESVWEGSGRRSVDQSSWLD